MLSSKEKTAFDVLILMPIFYKIPVLIFHVLKLFIFGRALLSIKLKVFPGV